MLQKLKERMKSTQRGAIMVFFALLVPLFLGMIGFAIDAGFLYMQKAKLQDIADAAALAGAGHLNDVNDSSHAGVTTAVSAFAEANGYKATGTSNNYIYDENYTSDDAVTLGDNEQWKLAQKVEKSVMDKDNVQRDHVRVLMVKRVPTFFIRFLFPTQKSVSVVVRALAVAEYVKGEQAVSGDAPVIMSRSYNTSNLKSRDSIVTKEGQNFSIYAPDSDVKFDMLPVGAVGTIFHSTHNGASAPSGWSVVRANNTHWDETNKKEKEALDEANNRYDRLVAESSAFINTQTANIEAYINPSQDSKKRFIGVDKNGNFINNIRDNDTEIELYMNATDGKWKRYEKCWLMNFELKNVQKINTLVMAYGGIIATKGITFGDVYTNGLHIGGENNNFTGMVYANGEGEFNVGGINNHFISNGQTSILNKGSTMNIGRWPVMTLLYDNGEVYIQENYSWISASGTWKIYFDGSSTGSSSSGSSGSDSSSKSRVRLVI